MLHFKMPLFSTPPRDAVQDVSLESDNEEEDQEVLDDLEHEEKLGIEETCRDAVEFNFLSNLAKSLPDVSSDEEEPVMEADPRSLMSKSLMKALLDPHAVDEETAAEVEGRVQQGNGSDDLDDTPFCIPCEGNVCFCKDKRRVTFFPSDKEYYEGLDEVSRSQVGDLD